MSQPSLGLLIKAAYDHPGLKLICPISCLPLRVLSHLTHPQAPTALGSFSCMKSLPLPSLSADAVWQVPTHSWKNV